MSPAVDVERLRRERQDRLFEAMAADDLDALILGRPANVSYASGAHQLWTAGARPWAPACVVLAASGDIHLLSVWDEGVPPEIPHDHLFGLTWDPTKLVRSLTAIPGLAAAARVGTDGLSPMFAELFPWPTVDAGHTLSEARGVKTADEISAITAAIEVAEDGLSSLIEAVRPGVTERQLLGLFAERVAELGTPILASESIALATARRGPVTFRHVPTDRAIEADQLVVLNPGVIHAGYEGGVGRTWAPEPTSEHRRLAARCHGALGALLGQCRDGRTGAHLRRAWQMTGEPLPPVPLAYGLGLGAEPPLIGDGVGHDAVLRAGAVLAVQSWVSEEGVGGFFEREVVLVGEGDPQVLSRFGHGPTS
ncbi:MAG TPA: M24 family metallopeptidase [Acidimicrobiales bacterium]|nr:M24 family metallopeptidase [Acidimicrobiales bacterium]